MRGKVLPVACLEGREGEWRCRSTQSETKDWMGMGGHPLPRSHYPREIICCVCFIFIVKWLVTPVLFSTKGCHLIYWRRNWRIFFFAVGMSFKNSKFYIFYYYWYSALGPVWADTRAQSGDWYGSGTLHPGQVLRGSLPLLSPAFFF